MAADKPEEACGVFGILAPEEEVAKLSYFGLFALQHRGQESAGIATFDGEKVHVQKDMGLVSQVFDNERLADMTGTHAIGHTRYSTTGSSHVNNAQPVVVPTRLGTVAIAHNGNLVSAAEMRQALMNAGRELISSTDSEGIAHAIAEEIDAGADWEDGIIAALKHCQGAFSLAIGTPHALIGTRDHNGIRPLVIGMLPSSHPEMTGDRTDPRYVLASETCALDIIGAEYIRSVEPGELVIITEQGLTSRRWADAAPKLCVFEMIYFARPDSNVHDESLYAYRTRLGEVLAEESPVDVDCVVAVPDSGRPAAIGFANTLHIPYMDGLIKNHYVGRTFIQPTQAMRERGIRMKLNPLRDVLQGKRIVLVDDSIVRGTTSRKIVQALRDAGALEVHMRISSPPVTHPCFYGIDTDNQDQLIAAQKSVKDIEAHIGVDSLAYLSWEGMLQATGRNPEDFCSACFTGDYPISIPDPLKRTKLMLEATAL
ncbi:MAG: amidophosphoribosyltransferase [Cyanobacteria bacterium P01_E01_bin.34]